MSFFLIVRWNLNWVPAHHPVAENSIQMQFTYTFTAPFQSEDHLGPSRISAMELF